MKKVVLFISILFLIACTNEASKKEDSEIQQEEIAFSAKNFVNKTIAYEKNGVVKLGVNKEDILMAFNDYSSKYGLGGVSKSYSIEKIDGAHYLRFYHKEGAASTVALLPSEKKSIDNDLITTYRSGSTVCTSVACASCCGCIPKGVYCEVCIPDVTDCKRTTTGPTTPPPGG